MSGWVLVRLLFRAPVEFPAFLVSLLQNLIMGMQLLVVLLLDAKSPADCIDIILIRSRGVTADRFVTDVLGALPVRIDIASCESCFYGILLQDFRLFFQSLFFGSQKIVNICRRIECSLSLRHRFSLRCSQPRFRQEHQLPCLWSATPGPRVSSLRLSVFAREVSRVRLIAGYSPSKDAKTQRRGPRSPELQSILCKICTTCRR